MRIAIMGTGAIGGYFGGRLAEAGAEVTFIARGATLEALRTRGLQVKSLAGDFSLQSVAVTDDPAQAVPADLVLVCVKAWQVVDAARSLRLLVGQETAVVPLQNGVEAVSQLSEVLGAERVLGGLCRILVRCDAPGMVIHEGADPEIVLGEQDHRRSARLERVLSLCKRARGLRARIAEDIHAEIWKKFVFISALSGVGAVADASIGTLREIPQTRALLRQCLDESIAVARGHGIRLADELASQLMSFVDGLPEAGTASMQRDLAAGKPSELEAQTGAVVRLGRATGVATPANDMIYAALLPRERLARAAQA